jgi:mono/diheme cytochrome c family protein
MRLHMKNIFTPFFLAVFAIPVVCFAGGKADFNAYCTTCHGGNARTNAKRAGMLKIDANKLYLKKSTMNSAEMVTIIEKGKGRMPGFANKLTRAQIIDIVNYVMSMKNK